MKTYLYLIRHGEVENPKKIIYGDLPNFCLSKRGKLQLTKLAEFFKEVQLDEIYSSPLLRSRETVKGIILHHPKMRIHFTKLLTEWDNPIWKGKTWEEIDQKELYIYRTCPTRLNLKGTEAVFDIEKRTKKLINNILANHKGQKLALVSHADPIRIARLHFEKKSLDNLHSTECTNASITTLVFKDDKLVKSDYLEIHPRAQLLFH